MQGVTSFEWECLNAKPISILHVADGEVDDLRQALSPTAEGCVVKFVQAGVFGQSLMLPRALMVLEGVIPRVQTDLAAIKEGDDVLVNWEPCEKLQGSVRYLGPAEDPLDSAVDAQERTASSRPRRTKSLDVLPLTNSKPES
jgi:hypothetical protein